MKTTFTEAQLESTTDVRLSLRELIILDAALKGMRDLAVAKICETGLGRNRTLNDLDPLDDPMEKVSKAKHVLEAQLSAEAAA